MTEQPRSRSDYELALFREMFTGHRGRLRTYVFELATSAVYILVGIAFLLNPADTSLHSAVRHVIYPFNYIWSLLYIAGGIAIIFGVMYPMLRIRAAGLIVLASALIMQLIAAASTHIEPRLGAYVIFAWACVLRAVLIARVFRQYQGISDAATSA